MENRLSSSGLFSQDLRHWKSPRRPKRICKIKTLSLHILKDELSSCQCSMTLTGKRKVIQKFVFRIPNKSRITRRVSREDTGHSSAKVMKKNGTECTPTNLKENGFHRYRNGGTIQRNRSPSIQEYQCFESWDLFFFLKKKETPYTSMRMLQTQNSYFDRFTEQISAVSTEQFQADVKRALNGLRIKKDSTVEKFTAKENKQLLKNVKSQEENSLLQTPRSNDGASGNRLREQHQRFGTLEKEIQFTSFCEGAAFVKRVSIGRRYNTVLDVDYGFGDRTSACREHTLPREDPNSRTNYNWTSGSSSYYTISWHQRTWNSDSFHNRKRSTLLDGDTPRQKSLRGRVTSQWSRPQSRKFWIAGAYRMGKTCCRKKEGPGSTKWRYHNSCEAVENSDESSEQSSWRIFLFQKGSGMKFLPIILSKDILWSRSLEIGHEIGGAIMIKTKEKRSVLFIGNRWVQTCDNHFRKWRTPFLGFWLTPSYLQSKQQNQVPILQKFPGRPTVYSRYSRTYWWESDSAWVDGSCRYSIQMEGILVSPRMLFWCHFNPQVRTDSWRKRKHWGTTNRLLHTSQPVRRQSRRRRAQRWPLKAEKSTLLQHWKILRTLSTGSMYAKHRRKDYHSGRQGLMPYLKTCRGATTEANDWGGTEKQWRFPRWSSWTKVIQNPSGGAEDAGRECNTRRRLTINSRERQLTKRSQECLKHEREPATRLHQASIHAHMSESRRARWPRGTMPGQKERQLREALTRRRDLAEFKSVETPTCTKNQNKKKRRVRTRRTIAADRSAKGCAPNDTAKQATRTKGRLQLKRHRHQEPRCGVGGPADHAVAEYQDQKKRSQTS